MNANELSWCERARYVSRDLWIFSFVMVAAALGLILERCNEVTRRHELYPLVRTPDSDHSVWASRNINIPNARHVWWTSDVFVTKDSQRVLAFGHDYMQTGGNWSELCRMDSNKDGLTNGQHLGDPCCQWRPSTDYFSLGGHREYRRWHLTHPSERGDISLANMAETLSLGDSPTACSNAYDAATYKQQLLTFYYHNAEGAHVDVSYHPLKAVCFILMVSVMAHWLFWKDLLADIFPWATSSKPVPFPSRVITCILSFFYMDMTSGIIHLVLDYAPQHLPGLGILARGFQFHHHDPTAIIRISWFEYVSHIHFLCPLIQTAVILSDASRLQRLFWFSGAVWSHLFQTAHRWAHMPPDSLPQIVRAMQSAGFLLSHERHMNHHEDLERQFTILSGHTDLIVDNLSSFMPPARYDLWLLFGVFWFLLPIFVDTACRDWVHRLQGTVGDVGRCKLQKIAKADV